MSVFGRILLATEVEEAVIDHMKLWLPTYLAEIERTLGLSAGAFPAPRSYTTKTEFENWPAEQLPSCVVISPGLADKPISSGDGVHRAGWVVNVAVVVSANTEENTKRNAKIYAAAVRALMVQHPSIGGFAIGTSWEDESYDDVPVEDSRSLAAGLISFVVDTDDVVSARGGLVTPAVNPLLPVSDPPQVNTIEVEIQKEGLL